MPIAPGTRIGVYEVSSLLGAGGMGEVYRARDTKLGREVAIKVLPEIVAEDSERVGRFEREAKSLAALNHPHVATLFGMEQVDARHLLVMELVEGETLAQALGRGPVPVPEAIRIACQVAEALESAHERGIVHRDLKPANVKLTPDDVVKVLDFGLAKAMESPPGAVTALSDSPTLSVMATAAGVILGTAAYMSPEQAKGLAADHRSDVFAFGALLYELLTGRPAFPGDTVHDILASVIAREPDWTALPSPLNPRLTELLRRCLAKSRRQRWQAIGDVRIELEGIAADPTEATAPVASAGEAPRQPVWRRALPVAAGALVATSMLAVAAWALRPALVPAPITRFELRAPQRGLNDAALAIAPDGSSVIFGSRSDTAPAGLGLMLREFSAFEPKLIPGVPTGENQPVWVAYSPDSRSIAFVDGSTVKTVPVAGGTPSTRGEVTGRVTGLSWDDDGQLVSLDPGGIVRLPRAGGERETVVQIEAGEHAARPSLLPGGNAILFTLATGTPAPDWSSAQVVVQPLDGSPRRVIVSPGSDARYLPTGHLGYATGGIWSVVPFDVDTLSATGASVPVIEGIGRTFGGGLLRPVAQVAVSETGTLAYFTGPESLLDTLGRGGSVMFTDRAGDDEPIRLPEAEYEGPRLSPDGKQLALSSDDGSEAIVWVYNLSTGGALRRLTFEGRNRVPVWSPEGRQLAFQSDREGDVAIYVQRADGAGNAERLTKAEPSTMHLPESWSSDGRYLSYSVVSDSGAELWLYDMRERRAQPFSDVRGAGPANSAFSPDGRWLAYTSRSGRPVIFVEPVPATGSRYQVSPFNDVGHHPFWSPDGRRLYYFGISGGTLVTVPVTTQPVFTVGETTVVPGSHISNTTALGPLNYDITADDRFVRVANQAVIAGRTSLALRVVVNWFEELKQRVPAK